MNHAAFKSGTPESRRLLDFLKVSDPVLGVCVVVTGKFLFEGDRDLFVQIE